MRGHRAGGIVVASVLVAVAALVILMVAGVLDLPGAALAARRAYWETAITTMRHVPLFGVGPESKMAMGTIS